MHGKLGFSILSIFGKVGRAALVHLREHSARGDGVMSVKERHCLVKCLVFFKDLLTDFPVFKAPALPKSYSVALVWTDAMFQRIGEDGLEVNSYEPMQDCYGVIAIVVLIGSELFFGHYVVKAELLHLLFGTRETYIGELETMGGATVYSSMGIRLQGMHVVHFIDNQGALWALVKGSSRNIATAAISQHNCMLQSQLDIKAWYEYVPSAANISDDPSRLDFEFVHRLRQQYGFSFIYVDLVLPEPYTAFGNQSAGFTPISDEASILQATQRIQR